MASISAPHLLGIVLVVQTRAGTGAQILFHYPPDPLADEEHAAQSPDPLAGDGSSSSDSDSESSSDDNVYEITTSNINDTSLEDKPKIADDGEDGDFDTGLSRVRSDERWKPSWEPLLGIGEEGLVSLLAPGRAWHKRKFELGINDLVFVGRPVYARDSGSWQKRRRKGVPRQDPQLEVVAEDEGTESDAEEQQQGLHDTEPGSAKSALTMFHAVFIMNPPALEHTLRVKDMYDNVIRKLSKVLKLEQAKADYIWAQTDLIQTIRANHYANQSPTNVYYNDLLKQSSLAAAIATIYRAISESRIAAVTLSPQTSISLQIPPVTSTSYLPSSTEPPIQPGIWLTTANDAISPHSDLDIDATKPNNALQLAKSFTLLLRDHPQKIVKEIRSSPGPLALALEGFINSLTASKSFYKISQLTALSLDDIQILSRHLIYWRRAIAIPPLHHRDTYIVSPNADFSQLMTATRSFQAVFPMLPSLPQFLSLLSRTPAPFGNLIPSSDHKEEYHRVLAWLLRGGWVTQLRTFAYIRVSPSVKKAVRELDRQEKHDTQVSNLERLNLQAQTNHQRASSSTTHTQPKPSTSATSTSTSFGSRTNPQPRNRPHLSRPTSSSTTTTTTTATRATTANGGPQHDPSHASLIASPLRASPLENKWIDHIQASLIPPPPSLLQEDTSSTTSDNSDATLEPDVAPKPRTASPHLPPPPDLNLNLNPDLWTHLTPTSRQELHDAWPRLIKYFNGSEALERIAVREGWKHKWVAELLERIADAGSQWEREGGAHDNSSREEKRRRASSGINLEPSGGGGEGVATQKEGVVVWVRHW